MSLKNKAAIVTGGNSGIGMAIALNKLLSTRLSRNTQVDSASSESELPSRHPPAGYRERQKRLVFTESVLGGLFGFGAPGSCYGGYN
jgi:hypothetical protein